MRPIALLAPLLLAAPFVSADATVLAGDTYSFVGTSEVADDFTVPAGTTILTFAVGGNPTAPAGAYALSAQLYDSHGLPVGTPCVVAESPGSVSGCVGGLGGSFPADEPGWSIRLHGAGSAEVTYSVTAE